jgi:hypothetical protein
MCHGLQPVVVLFIYFGDYHIFLTIFIVEKEGVKLFTNEGGA